MSASARLKAKPPLARLSPTSIPIDPKWKSVAQGGPSASTQTDPWEDWAAVIAVMTHLPVMLQIGPSGFL